MLDSGVIHKPSEYKQLIGNLTPLSDGISFAKLEESDEHHDISFLNDETGRDPQHINALAAAHRFEDYAREKSGEETGDLFSLTAPVFYVFFREGMPARNINQLRTHIKHAHPT